MAGFSLGEYAAAVAAGALTLEQALRIVQYRAQAMERVHGGMMAVLGMEAPEVEAMCTELEGVLEPVNYNCPGQTVVAGEEGALDAFEPLAKTKGAKTRRLAVSCPSHSSLMREVGEKLQERLASETFAEPGIALVANVTGDWVQAGTLKALMAQQVMSPVRWEKGIRTMLASGVTHFVEVGPGKTLAGFLKRIERGVPVYSAEDAASLEQTIKQLQA